MHMEDAIKKLEQKAVHSVLARSYATYFFAFLLGIACDTFFQLRVFSASCWVATGFVFLALGSLLILWAQYTSYNLKTETSVRKENFSHGPYRFSRTPTNFGLFFLLLGFGLVINSLFVILFTLIAFLIAKFVFLNKEEELLAQKYGAPYLEYKKSVKF